MSRQYFTDVNVTNTVINVTKVTNVYNDRDVYRVAFVNRQVAGAVVTVLAGPVQSLFGQAADLLSMSGVACEAFYGGTVAPPK